MSKILVVYCSMSGRTKAAAKAIAEGAKGAGAQVAILAALLTCGLALAQTSEVRPDVKPPDMGVQSGGQLPIQLSRSAQGGQVSTNAPKAPDKALTRIHAFVTGKVQGVGFRAFTSQKVETLNLKVTGWVKNLPDGRVELVAEGPATDLDRLMTEVAKGPAGSRVDAVERKDEAYTGGFAHFKIAQ